MLIYSLEGEKRSNYQVVRYTFTALWYQFFKHVRFEVKSWCFSFYWGGV